MPPRYNHSFVHVTSSFRFRKREDRKQLLDKNTVRTARRDNKKRDRKAR